MPIVEPTDEEIIDFCNNEDNKKKILSVYGWDEKTLNEIKIKYDEQVKMTANLLSKIPAGKNTDDKPTENSFDGKSLADVFDFVKVKEEKEKVKK
jgi:hypothetical protein